MGRERGFPLRPMGASPLGRPFVVRTGGRQVSSAQPSPALRAYSPVAEPVAFDVCGPLPKGVTLLEASAGTGKTFTIASLVTRYVAEGTPLERLLVVTFTRMATGELRDRVRHGLVTTAAGLAQAMEGASESDDPLIRLLSSGT